MIRVLGILLGMAFSLQADEWKLVWSDEFSGQGIPDPSYWSTEKGFLRNNEKQFYTGDRAENVRQDNGLLILECRREDFSSPDQGVVQFTSGSVTTKGKVSWRYRKFDIRARMPSGRGSWASLWLMGVADSQGKPWPACGEIDVGEHVGKYPDDIFGTVHFQKEGRQRQKGFQTDEGEPEHKFHIYSAEWNPDRITFFLDGEEYGSFRTRQAGEDGKNAFAEPFYLTLSLALGGTWGGEVDETILPQQLLVDYVRVYRSEETPEAKATWDIGSSRSR